MANDLIGIFDAKTGEQTVREMTDAEQKAHDAEKTVSTFNYPTIESLNN